MGQYFMATLVDGNNNMKTVCAHDYGNGLKLMEHSYIGNDFMAAVMNALEDKPHRVWWLGDYAETEDFKNKNHRLLSKDRNKAWRDNKKIFPLGDWDWSSDTYLVNLDKKCFIQLEKYDENKWSIHPLSLLTAVGNGRGSGDYRSYAGEYDVGSWAGDELMITHTKPEILSDFTDDYYFSEE